MSSIYRNPYEVAEHVHDDLSNSIAITPTLLGLVITLTEETTGVHADFVLNEVEAWSEDLKSFVFEVLDRLRGQGAEIAQDLIYDGTDVELVWFGIEEAFRELGGTIETKAFEAIDKVARIDSLRRE